MARIATLPFVVVLVTAAIAVRAQSTDQKPLTFEVASVKVNSSGDRRASMQMNLPDAFVATNQTLRSLVSILYQVPVFKMVGEPNWLGTERFDIAAKADHRITMDEKRAMARSLLENRFKLKTHRETHEGRIYALAIARSDGKLGPNLKPSAYDCANILAARQRGETPTVPPPTPGDPPPCGAFAGPKFRARGVQIASFAISLSAMMRETIVDDTSLMGWWDFDVDLNFVGFDGPPVGAVAPTSDTPSIFTSLQEQLGLKLEPRRGPIETLVIDHVEKPTPD
jgi:uncharacterized protein (TIGR03435 family)